MGLFLRQDEQRSEVQTKVATELQERLRAKASIEQREVEPGLLENQHQTRKAGMVIIVLIVILMVAVAAFAVKLSL
jgi:cell division protein FtsX